MARRAEGGLGATLRRGMEAPPEFLEDRRATILARVRLASVCAAIAIGAALLSSPLLDQSWTLRWLIGVTLQLSLCGVAYWLAAKRWMEPRADVLAGSFLLLLALCIPFTVALAPAKLEIIVGYLILLVVAALFFPWGSGRRWRCRPFSRSASG